MGTDAPSSIRNIPPWVWLVCLGLALLEPILHIWIAYFPPAGALPTGLHIADDTVFLHAMAMFETDFYSPFASCHSEIGSQSMTFYASPFHWLYGLVGWAGRLVHSNAFMFLGVANGLSMFIYLFVSYLLLREIAPRVANLAFLLFSLGGGLGGVLYVVTGVVGLHPSSHFDEYFTRFAVHELIEGPYLSPALHAPRLYYTLALALGYGALGAFVRGARIAKRRFVALSMVLIFLASFINLRFGVPMACVAVLYLYDENRRPFWVRVRLGAYFLLPALFGLTAAFAMMNTSPTFVSNNVGLVTSSMWLTPFLSAIFIHLFIMPRETYISIANATRAVTVGAYGLAGYLAAFAVLSVAATAYYGNWFVFWDYGAALKVSDWAIPAFIGGALFGLHRTRSRPLWKGAAPVQGWISGWFLLFTALALSAFLQGRYLSLSPSRLMPLLGIPLCVLSASGLQRLSKVRPRVATGLVTACVGCGLVSISVGTLFFQGPLNRQPGKGPFAWLHAELMSEEDGRLIARIEEGRVLVPSSDHPPSMGDVVVLRPGVQAVFAFGMLDLSDQDFFTMKDEVAEFFTQGTPEPVRRIAAKGWCADYVYCPDTWPLGPEIIAELEDISWLETIARDGRGALFRVTFTPEGG